MNSNLKTIILISSMFVSLGLVSLAAFDYWHGRDNTEAQSTQTKKQTVSLDELKRSNGKMGQTCLVAIDGTVYKIEGFSQWKDGVHTPSEGQAYCGADLSAVIDKAPHGRSKLQYLEIIGPLGD